MSLKFGLISKIFFILLATSYKNQVVEAVYCYVCTEANPACADPVDYSVLRYFVEPCNGDCIIYTNPNTGLLTRSCSWYLGIMTPQTNVRTIDGVTFTFCSTDLCNIGPAGEIVTTTTTSTTTSTTTTTTTTTTSTTTTTTTSRVCDRACENGGTQNSDCTCRCLPSYSGIFCEILNCEVKYEICIGATTAECGQNPLLPIFCPNLCDQRCL